MADEFLPSGYQKRFQQHIQLGDLSEAFDKSLQLSANPSLHCGNESRGFACRNYWKVLKKSIKRSINTAEGSH